MPHLSERGETMPASPIRKLVPYAEKARAAGIDVIHLNIGQPDIETPEVMMDVLKTMDMPILSYSPSEGYTEYREVLAGYYQGLGLDIHKEEIIVTTGGSEAIMFAFMACLNVGDEVIIPEPYYANYNGFAKEVGVHIQTVQCFIEDGFALPPVDEIDKMITERTKAILICNPNNPTGYLYTQDELERLKKICQKHNLFLMSDEAYREFTYDGMTQISALSLKGMENHTILLDTISKRYSACGARLGCLVTKNAEVRAAALKFAQARLSPPSIEQHVAMKLSEVGQDYFDSVNKEFEERRNLLVEGLNKIPGVICPNPGGAFYVVVELPVENADDFCRWLLDEFSYDGSTVMLAPSSGFYSKDEYGKNQVRIAYVLNNERISKSLLCLEKALKTYTRKNSVSI